MRKAIVLDPEDRLAYAGLAQGYTLIGHGANPPPGAFATAREAARKALALDPLFPEAHAAMAEIQLYYDWDWDGAETSFRRALQLNPNVEFAHAHFAWLHQLVGRSDAAPIAPQAARRAADRVSTVRRRSAIRSTRANIAPLTAPQADQTPANSGTGTGRARMS